MVSLIFTCRFCVINAALVYFYASSFQGIDEEEFGGMWELTKEGFVTSFAGFLVRITLVLICFNGVCFKQYWQENVT